MNLQQLVLKPKRERSVILRHPWLFSGAIASLPKDAKDGDIVAVLSSEKVILGYGFFSAKSQIVCRMFHWGTSDEDFFTVKYWESKIRNAEELRANLVRSELTNAYRLIHAEGDFLPGIIIDIYNNVAVMQLLIKGTEHIKEYLINALQNCGYTNIYMKTKASSEAIEGINSPAGWLAGNHHSPVSILENGLKFQVDFIDGQKTGFFIDQRDSRHLLQKFSSGKTVLNCFSYTGGFSVYALAGGATQVQSVDISNTAIDQCNQNVHLNADRYDVQKHQSLAIDCFEYLKTMPENEFDIIVLDPPAFAKHARAVDNATRGYKQINMRAFQKIKPGGLLFTFSCSQNISQELFQKIIFGAAADVGRNVRIVYQVHQGADHPINIYHPEGSYLKGLVLWVS